MKLDSFFSTKRIGHDIHLTRMVANFAIVIVQEFNPTSLPHVQLFLIKNMLETFVVCENHTLRSIEVVSPDLKHENHCS
ncbi:hypothetical protein Hanom_Chr05g00413231 [Helianthus anomalus]